MFVTAFSYVIYAIYTVIALVGIVLIVSGVIARRRGVRGGGLALVIVGIVIVLLPVGVAASSYLPGQQ